MGSSGGGANVGGAGTGAGPQGGGGSAPIPGCPFQPPAGVGDAPLPDEAPHGQGESTGIDGFSDEYLHNGSGTIKVGVRRQWGGTIVFFGTTDGKPGMNGTNTIDANDTGREVQVALYDPDRAMQNCAHNASCAKTPSSCPQSITFLGWNPVQGGNRCNNGSGVESVTHDAGTLAIATVPLQWNPNWDFVDCSSSGCSDPNLAKRPADVRLGQRLRFVSPHVLEMTYAVENLVATDHASTVQEMPTLYASNGKKGPNLHRLFDAAGKQVPIDVPAGNEDGFFYKNFDSPASWVSLQNTNADYGVGILYENGETKYQGWQHPGVPFNNVRARFAFGLPAKATVRARAYLLIGSLATITSEASWLLSHLPPFGYLDAPGANDEVSGTTAIGGWALDNRGVSKVRLRIDATTEVALSYGSSRPDVCRVWPGYPKCDAVGFSGSYDFSQLAPSPCRLLEVIATDGDGNDRVIAARLVASKP